MTSEEIKQAYSMSDILERYGLRPNRSGFIQCPFHQGDRTASLKIYKDSFYCYGCGEHGDVFKFVMLMDGVSFKDAFLSLGGEYQKPESRREEIHRKRDLLLAKQQREREARKREEKRKRMIICADEALLFRSLSRAWKPFSDQWCECIEKAFAYQIEFDELWEEVSKNIWQSTKS